MAKPDGHLEWCVGNAIPANVIQEPSGAKKIAGWVGAESPYSEHMNWLFNQQDLWNKYLEEITDAHEADIAILSGIDGGISSAITTLQAEMDAVEGVNGTQNTTLGTHTSQIAQLIIDVDAVEAVNTTQNTTLSSHGTRLTQAEADIDAIEVVNTSQGTTIATHTSQIAALALVDTGHGSRLTALETLTAVTAALTTDMWEWEAGRGGGVTGIAASGNNLVWTASATFSNYQTCVPFAAHHSARYWEILMNFAQGLTLKIVDGGGHTWLVIPTAAGIATFNTYVQLAGTYTSVASLTNTILATGAGTLFTIRRNGSVLTNFSTFTSLASGSMTSASFRWVLYGDQALVKSVTAQFRPKKKWHRQFFPPGFAAHPSGSPVIGYDLQFEVGKTYRVNLLFNATGSSDVGCQWANSSSTFNASTALNESNFDFTVLGEQPIVCDFEFVALTSGLAYQFSNTFSDENGFHTFSTASANLLERNLPAIFITEV